MGQTSQDDDKDRDDVIASASANNTQHNKNVQDYDDDANKKLLQKVKFSGNFRNYREMKMKQLTATKASIVDGQQSHNKDDDDENWNHFTTPLKPSIISSSSSSSSSSQTSTIEETHKPINNNNNVMATQSVFSDLERTQTIDRFGHIFVITSGTLSTAWGGGSSSSSSSSSSNNNGGMMFSWLFTDYSPNAIKEPAEGAIVNPEEYAAERRMITPHLTPFVWGTTCVAVSLFSIRLGRWYQGRTLGRTATSSSLNNGRNRSNYNTTTTTTAAAIERNRLQDLRSNKSPQGYGHYNNNNVDNNPASYQNQTNALLSNLSTLPVDLAISLLVGISTSIFLTRPADLLNDFSNAPLLKGKSVLREELCPPFSQEMELINQGYHTYTPSGMNNTKEMMKKKQVVSFQELWKDENMGDFDSLKAIRDFVENCHVEKENVQTQARTSNSNSNSNNS